MKIAIALIVAFSVYAGSVFASDDYITKETYGGTTYFTDQDGRTAVGQESGGIYTLYDNGSGLVDSGRVTVND